MHTRCRYDFGPWPLLQGMTALPPSSLQLLRETRAVFTNGFVFDELPLDVVQVACREAIQGGAAVFFDPGGKGPLKGPNHSLLLTATSSGAACTG